MLRARFRGAAELRGALLPVHRRRICASTWRSSGSGRSTRWWAGWTCSRSSRRSTHWKAKGLDFSRSPAARPATDGPARCAASAGRITVRERPRPRLMRSVQAAPRAEGAGGGRAADPERPSHRRRRDVGGRSSGGTAAGPSGRHDPPELPRIRGAELRRVSRPGRHDARGGRRQRLTSARGCRGGRIIVTPPDEALFPPHENIIAGNVRAVRRHRRRGLPQRHGRRAVRRAQQRRQGRRRGAGRPRVRIHDRRRRGGAGHDRASTSRRA